MKGEKYMAADKKEAASKQEALENALKKIEKDFGKGSIMRLGDAKAHMDIEVIPTGILPLDIALGVGGIPRGRIIEVYGPESSGKTTVTLHMIAEAQKNGGIAAFIDAEHALDPVYAAKLGVNIDDLLISQPDTGEQALDIVDALVRSGAIDIIVVDSVAALVPKAEIEGDMGDSHVGLQARLMSQAMRKLTGIIAKSRTAAIFINQIREKVGVMFGNPETTTGGRALKFYSSVRLDVRKIDTLKQGQDVIGNRTRIKVVKNKVAPPFRTAEFDIMYGEGVSRLSSIIDMGVDLDIVDKSGAWFSYNGTRLGQGKENAKQSLRDQPAICEEIEPRFVPSCLRIPRRAIRSSRRRQSRAGNEALRPMTKHDVPKLPRSSGTSDEEPPRPRRRARRNRARRAEAQRMGRLLQPRQNRRRRPS